MVGIADFVSIVNNFSKDRLSN